MSPLIAPVRWFCLLLLALCSAASHAGTLTKAQVAAMFPPPMLVGEMLGHLPVWPVFAPSGQGPVLHNYVFETVDLEPVAGYGGKPLNVLVVMDRDGTFVSSRLLSHMEPIFRSAAGTAQLDGFAQQYKGVTVHHQVHVLGAKAQRVVTPTIATLHGVVAGTVSVNAIDRSIMESAAQVAQAAQAALTDPKAVPLKPASGGRDDRYQRTGFNGLMTAQLLQPWAIEHQALNAAFAGTAGAGRDSEATIRAKIAGVDLWLAFVAIPQAGRNLLDPPRWREVRALREQGVPVLMALDGGRYGLVEPSAAAGGQRGATLSLKQEGRSFVLEPLAWQKGLRMSGQHSGVSGTSVPRYFKLRAADGGAALDVWQPVEMELAVWRRTAEGTGSATSHATSHVTSDAPIDIARVGFKRVFSIAQAEDFRPQAETPKWLEPWGQRQIDLLVLGAGLIVLTAGLVWQRKTAASAQRLRGFRIAFLLFTLVFIGWYAQGQLTIVSLTALVEALAAGRSAEFLLADPMAVVLWIFTFASLLVWGRGTFCGWLCPFGALQELVALLAKRLGLVQRHLRLHTDHALKRIKYGVLAVLLGTAAVASPLTDTLVEVEPFKTAISLHFQREWPYLLFAVACLVLGTVVYRGYCRYICPLGAALAVLGRVRIFNWIPRRAECGTPCQTCRHRCEYQAIEPTGKVDYTECFQCLDCVQTHDNPKACLPLVLQHKGRTIPIRALKPATT